MISPSVFSLESLPVLAEAFHFCIQCQVAVVSFLGGNPWQIREEYHPIPEPMTSAAVGIGFLGIAIAIYRRKWRR